MNQKQSIEASIKKQSDKKKANYLVRIKTSFTAAKYLLRGGLAFRAHDESDDSSYKRNFLELIEVLGLNNQEIGKVVLKKAPKNHKMTSPDIQKEFVNACAVETINKIVNEIGDNTFGVLVDESCDSSGKEQMAVVACYIDDKGFVVERFIDIIHVKETSALSLKNALETLLCSYKLSMSKIIGQGYDGTSYMCGRFGVIEVLQELEIDASSDKDGEAKILLLVMQPFDFVFMLHLMDDVLGVTNYLCVALQRGDQDILNALNLVSVSKQRLQEMRSDGWKEFLDKMVSSCKNLNVKIPDTEAQYVKQLKSKCLALVVSNLHHYKFDCFVIILDVQLKELNDRFVIENTELLKCVASLSPCSSFETFDTKQLLKMARMYPNEFSEVDDQTLTNQFECYIRSVRGDPRFSDLKGLARLCRTLVQTKKHICYNWIFELVKLAFLLPATTTSVERVFSAMKYVKNELRNRMSDPWLNDCRITYVETILNRFQAISKRRVQVKISLIIFIFYF
ncbi:hypothetical protein LIER_22165 [Lithospermum erythrorhizon]|uniref:DUF4371 domain-containing protein n=1 Tax=Lithospermum erythrorhizon TaxID=34254 RepID=A0AAV3QT09_LITER